MKKIRILQENVDPIDLIDNDKSNLSKYTSKLSSILEASNVTILNISSGNVILRPHKINSIIVTEEEQKVNSTVIKNEEKEDVIEDIITDKD